MFVPSTITLSTPIFGIWMRPTGWPCPGAAVVGAGPVLSGTVVDVLSFDPWTAFFNSWSSWDRSTEREVDWVSGAACPKWGRVVRCAPTGLMVVG